MPPLLNEYKEKLLREGMAPATVHGRCKNLIYFSRYLGHEDMRKITPKMIEQYKIHLMTEYRTKDGKPLKSSSILNRLLALAPYFKFLEQNKKIFFDPTINLKLPKREKRLPDYIPSEHDVEQLLVAPDTNVFMGIRDRVILELLYTCPLRNKELRELELGDIDMKDKYIYPKRVKGGERCAIPIAESTYEVLKKYLEISRPRLAMHQKTRSDALFLTERGTPLNPTALSFIFRKYRTNKLIHPHSMRHACAVHMLRHGACIREIQIMLGHRRLSSTQIYTSLTANDLKDLHRKHHPREKRFKHDSANR